MSLNPRFDGAFLNFYFSEFSGALKGLNPRFDGAFLNCIFFEQVLILSGLNPRFDGAFLNSNVEDVLQKLYLS